MVEVAAGLGISTIETEMLLTSLFATMGAVTQAEAVAVAHKRGLLMGEPVAIDVGYHRRAR